MPYGAVPLLLAIMAAPLLIVGPIMLPHATERAFGSRSGSPGRGVETVITAEMVTHHDWAEGLGESFWRNLREQSGRGREPPGDAPRAGPRTKRSEGSGHTVRTLCVRLCDGYYWPVSFATPHGRLARDAAQCERICPSVGRLFYHRNPGQAVDDMVDLEGQPYRALPTAYLYRARYVADCRCRAQPWDEEALARHRAYAEAPDSPANGKSRPSPASKP
jgi:hypothetical protein